MKKSFWVVTLGLLILLGACALIQQPVSFDPFADESLLVYFPFDGTLEGIVKGATATAITCGSTIGTPGGTITYVEGKKGEAAVFDGTSGVVLPDDIVNDYDYTIAFWVNMHAFTDHTPTVFGSSEVGWISYMVPKPWWRNPGEPAIWSLSGEQWSTYEMDTLLSSNTWYHVAIVVDEGNPKAYVNGATVSLSSLENLPLPDIFTDATSTIAVGVNYWDPPFQGMIDELFIFDRSLSRSEILTLYNLGYGE